MDENKINHLNMLEQNLAQISQQKQAMQAQILEIDSAFEELNGDEAFKLIGNILVKKDSKELKKELEEQKTDLSKRIDTLSGQQTQIQQKAEALRKELMKDDK